MALASPLAVSFPTRSTIALISSGLPGISRIIHAIAAAAVAGLFHL